jgi:hypothetical protein
MGGRSPDHGTGSQFQPKRRGLKGTLPVCAREIEVNIEELVLHDFTSIDSDTVRVLLAQHLAEWLGHGFGRSPGDEVDGTPLSKAAVSTRSAEVARIAGRRAAEMVQRSLTGAIASGDPLTETKTSRRLVRR